MTRRVIGVGNPLRGDDAVGLEVADRVEALAGDVVEVRRCAGDAAALLDAWAGHDDVVVVDAARAGHPVGTVLRLAPEEVAAGRLGAGTHDAGLVDALALAAALDRVPERLRVYAIVGADFTLGRPLSSAVAGAASNLARELARPAPRRAAARGPTDKQAEIARLQTEEGGPGAEGARADAMLRRR